jgi:dienelactone hydrolase
MSHLDRFGDAPVRIHSAGHAGAPAVLFFHGLGVSGAVNAKEADSLAAAGLTTVLVDAPHHGARRSALLEEMRDASEQVRHRNFSRMLREARAEVPLLVDRLLADGHPRVGICGISMGGFIALAAATVEPRLAAVVSILGSPSFDPRGEIGDRSPDEPEAMPERFPPRPLLLLNAGRDERVPPGPAQRFAECLRPIYAERGGGPLVQHVYPNSGHTMNESDWNDLWARTVEFLVAALRS